MEKELTIGMKAPAFTLLNQHGEKVALKDFLGKKVALFFYPEDDTPTCTQEVCNLRDNFSELKKQGITLLGVSPDDVSSHEGFIEKFNLPFTLLSDTSLKVMKTYNVWGEKNMYGHKFMGVKRTTFLIDERGIIVHIIKKVLSKKHHEQILKAWGYK